MSPLKTLGYLGRSTLQAAAVGGILGAIAGLGPLGAVVAGGVSGVLGVDALYKAWEDRNRNGANICNFGQAVLGIAGIVGGATAAIRNAPGAVNQGKQIGNDIRKWWTGDDVGQQNNPPSNLGGSNPSGRLVTYTDVRGKNWTYTEYPDRLVMPNGDTIFLPQGAVGPTITDTGKGFAYTGGSGGAGFDPRVTAVRIMPPEAARGASPGYPYGYYVYMNSQPQTVNPYTGRTIPFTDPFAHIPLGPP